MKINDGRWLLWCLFLILFIPKTTAEPTTYDFSYDQNGNLQQGLGYYLEYNDFNQLVKVRNNNASGSLIEEYYYDYNNQRYKKITYNNNETTYYINDNFIQTRNATGVYNETYYYDKELVAKRDNNNLTFLKILIR